MVSSTQHLPQLILGVHRVEAARQREGLVSLQQMGQAAHLWAYTGGIQYETEDVQAGMCKRLPTLGYLKQLRLL